MKKIIILRGSPASGKTTISKKLHAELYQKFNKDIAYLPWDYFFNFFLPNDIISDDKILRSTSLLCKTLQHIVDEHLSDYIIIDGVFLFDEEITLFKKFENISTQLFFIKLSVPFDIISQRNKERFADDFLDESRLICVYDTFNKQKNIDNEIIIDNASIHIENCLTQIINHINK
jgi:tRNA uridine 5-carbamoylmethylation protein Kti12